MCNVLRANRLHRLPFGNGMLHLLQLGEGLAGVTRVGGILLLSGLLAGSQVESIEGYFRDRHFEAIERRERGEWAALGLRRRG